MTQRRALLYALISFLSVLMPSTVGAQVRGHVTDATSGDPVGGALVWLAGRTIHLARSAPDGAYEFRGAPAGSYCIRVDTPGYETAAVCISVSAAARMIVDLPLTIRPVVMEPLTVLGRRGVDTGSPGNPADSLRATVMDQRMSLLGTQSSALAGAQLGDLTHMPATDQSGGRRPNTLYVWGSSAERGRVLLDGASLSAPLHLGALLPPLDPAVIAGASVHTGGISPRYDGGTSYIMDFTTRPAADELRLWGELDLLAGRIGAETPINGRGSAIVSARRVNDEVIDGLVSSRFGYDYSDALARADVDLGADHRVHATAVTTHEAVGIPRDLGKDRASWINRAATLVWERDRVNDMQSATLSVSRGVADLPLLSAPGGHLEAGLDRYSGVVQRRWRSGALGWDAGAEVEHLEFRRTSRATADPSTGEPEPVRCTALLPCSHARATLASAFAELSLNLVHGVATSFGARTMYDFDSERVHVLPRASVTFLPYDRWALTLAGGRFSQAYVRETPLLPGDRTVDPIDVDIAHATHLELGVARRSPRLAIHAGAYVRYHARVEPTAHPRTVPGADASVELVTRRGTLSFAYSVSGGPGRSDDDAATQQLATAGFHGDRGRWSLDFTTAYGSGLPLTSIVLDSPEVAQDGLQPTSTVQPGAPGDPARSGRAYLRLDARIGAEWLIGTGDRAIRIMPYARIINALSQRDALFYFQDDGEIGQPPRALARIPAVPVIGLRWTF